jgi:hypothetical protein
VVPEPIIVKQPEARLWCGRMQLIDRDDDSKYVLLCLYKHNDSCTILRGLAGEGYGSTTYAQHRGHAQCSSLGTVI